MHVKIQAQQRSEALKAQYCKHLSVLLSFCANPPQLFFDSKRRLLQCSRIDFLQDLFSRFGPVLSCRIIMDHDTGRSKGYGFISMGTASHAAAAVNSLDNYMFPGANKPMSVKIADQNRQQGGRPSGFGGDLLQSDIPPDI